MTACRNCGNPVPDGTAFCTSCGENVPPEEPFSGPGPADTGEVLVWERKVPLITNPYLVMQCIAIPLGAGILLGLLFLPLSGAPEMLLLFAVLGAFLAGLFLVVLLLLQLATGGGLLTTFFISSRGVAYRAGSVTRSADRAVTAVAALGGSAGGAGAGLLAMSEEESMLRWEDVRYISIYPKVRSLVFRSRWLIGPVVLYCTEENFARVRSMAGTYAPKDAAGRPDA